MGLKIGLGKMPGYIRGAEKALQAVSCSLSLLPGHGLGARGGCSPLGLNLMMPQEFFGSLYSRKEIFFTLS